MLSESIMLLDNNKIEIVFDGSVLTITQRFDDEVSSITLVEDKELNINEFHQVMDVYNKMKSSCGGQIQCKV